MEKFLTLKEAADRVGAHYWQLARLAKRGGLPVYRPYNSRKLVRLSEVMAVIEASRTEASDDRL